MFFSCIAVSPANAQDRTFQHEFQFNFGENSQQALELEFAYSFMYRKTAGITLGLNNMGQISNPFYHFREGPNIYKWVVAGSQRNAFTVLLRPALRFRFPILRQEGENVLYFNIEPGAFINLIPNKTLRFDYIDMFNVIYYPLAHEEVAGTGGRSLFYHVKGYLTFDVDNCMFSAGFGYSDFDIYSGWRNIVFKDIRVNDLIWSRRTTRTLFLSVGYYF